MPMKIYYVDATRLAERVARWMLRGCSLGLERLRFDAKEIFDERGALVWQRLYYDDLAKVLACAESLPTFRAALAEGGDTDYHRGFLVKSFIPGKYLAFGPGAWRAIYLVQVARWLARKLDIAEGQTILFLRRIAWFDAIIKYAAGFGAMRLVATGRAFGVFDALLRIVGRDARLFFGWLRGGITRVSPRVPPAQPCVAFQYYGHFNLNQPARYSDFFFWQQSDLPGRNVLALFGFPQDRLDDARMSEMARYGIRGLALHRSAAAGAAPFYAHSRLGARLRDAVRLMLPNSHPETDRWLEAESSVFHAVREYWHDLFTANNVKVFVSWYKYVGDHCAIGQAIRDHGGVSALFQRSYEGNPSAQAMTMADVFFGFSKATAEVERHSGSCIPYYIVTGYLGDHRFRLVREAAQQLRQRLLQRGARYVAAFFDENSFPDGRWGPDAGRAQGHYAFVLERVLAEPELGLVIKPKTPATLMKRLGPVACLLEKALKTGRCILYDEGTLQGSIPPVQAALAADLAIHSSVTAGTAGVESALAGVPTVMFDDEGWRTSPLYRLGLNRVVFNDLNTLWDMWARHRASPGDVEGFGDWTDMLDDLDPFRDGRAAERMGAFLQWLIEGFEEGRSREHVLAEAAERYRQTWGADKVISLLP